MHDVLCEFVLIGFGICGKQLDIKSGIGSLYAQPRPLAVVWGIVLLCSVFNLIRDLVKLGSRRLTSSVIVIHGDSLTVTDTGHESVTS